MIDVDVVEKAKRKLCASVVVVCFKMHCHRTSNGINDEYTDAHIGAVVILASRRHARRSH